MLHIQAYIYVQNFALALGLGLTLPVTHASIEARQGSSAGFPGDTEELITPDEDFGLCSIRFSGVTTVTGAITTGRAFDSGQAF